MKRELGLEDKLPFGPYAHKHYIESLIYYHPDYMIALYWRCVKFKQGIFKREVIALMTEENLI